MSTTYYSISQFINGKHAFTSDLFKTREAAEDFLEAYLSYEHEDVDYAIFKSRTRDEIREVQEEDEELVVDEQEYDDYEMEEDLSSMSVEDYGKGYLLRANSDDERFGEKYFLDGWWNAKAQGWFFRSQFLSGLLEMGAQYISDEVHDGYEECEVVGACDECEEFDEDLTSMKLYRYGKGYLLKPRKSDERFGMKYFLDGWWMPSQSGWFFKKEFKQMLKDLGAKYVKSSSKSSKSSTSPSTKSSRTSSNSSKKSSSTKSKRITRSSNSSQTKVEESETFDTQGAKFRKHGKGWILVPKKSHPDYGEKYYHGGWWFPSQNAWFFRNSVYEGLNL